MQPGDRIAQRWEIEKVAASGGMSRVYRARDLETEERVAVKIVMTAGDDAAARFEREARLLADLEHPSILRYLAHGRSDHGMYLVTEWLDGEDLGARLKETPLDLDESVALVERVAEVLGVAHRRGIVHRDIKPQNIFLVGGDLRRVKLLDFGIARLADNELELTTPGLVVGTRGYMAPEQASGAPIDARTDVFALGCLLFRLIAGKTPHQGRDHVAVLAKLVLEDAPRLRSVVAGVPPDVDALCASLLARSPSGRPADATAVVEALRALGTARGALGRESDPGLALGAEERRLVSLVLARRALPAAPPSDTPSPQPVAHHAPWLVRENADSDIATAVAPAFRDTSASEEDDVASLERALLRVARRHVASLDRLADGSVVMTVTGGSVATDLAARAGRIALDLRELLPTPPIALATGMTESGDVATVGDVVDRAIDALGRVGDGSAGPPARLGAAIALDDVSRALLEHRFVIERSGEAAMLVSLREHVDAPRQLLGRVTPFVGREREMSSLEAFFSECVEEPMSRTVVITGASGAGKTRLRHELVERLTESAPGVELLFGAGDPVSATSAFSLVASVLRRRFGLAMGEPVPRQHAQIATVVSDVIVGSERDRIVTFLSEMIGVPLPDDNNVQLRAARKNATLMGDQMRLAFTDYLSAVASSRPLLVLLDDLQWADLPSLKLIETATSALRDRPLFVVGFARPEVRTAFPSLFSGSRVSELALGPLSRRASEEIARATLGDAAEDTFVAKLVAHAQGNPFFIEEMLRSSAEGRLDALPETVLATLQTRLSSLESDARRILRAAAIFGQTFWAGGLEALLGTPGEETAWIAPWMRHLYEREWIALRPASSVRDEVEWCFAHSTFREAAYATLTDKDRRRGHRLAARWLAARGAADAMALAEHFERGGEPERAVPHYEKAARKALEGDDLEAALERAVRGLACAEAETAETLRVERGMLHLVRAEAHRHRGENQDAAKMALEAMQYLVPRSAAWFNAIAEAATAAGRIDAVDDLLSLTAHFERLPVGAEAIEAFCLAASREVIALSHRGYHVEAQTVLEAAERAARTIETPGPQGQAAIAVGRSTLAHSELRPAAALDGARSAVRELERAGDRRNACMQRVNVGWSYVVLGQYARAESELEAALEGALALGLEDAAAMARQNLGLALALGGEASRAIGVLEVAREAFGRQHNRVMDATTRVYLALAKMVAGDLEAAEIECRGAIVLLDGMPATRCFALARLSSILRAAGKIDHANAAAFDAVADLKRAERVQEGETLVRLEHVHALESTRAFDRARSELLSLKGRLLGSAGEIADPELAASFLRGVYEHDRILTLAAKLDTH